MSFLSVTPDDKWSLTGWSKAFHNVWFLFFQHLFLSAFMFVTYSTKRLQSCASEQTMVNSVWQQPFVIIRWTECYQFSSVFSTLCVYNLIFCSSQTNEGPQGHNLAVSYRRN